MKRLLFVVVPFLAIFMGMCTVSMVKNTFGGNPPAKAQAQAKTPTPGKGITYVYQWGSSELAAWMGMKPEAITAISIVNGACRVTFVDRLTQVQLERLRSWMVAIGCTPGEAR